MAEHMTLVCDRNARGGHPCPNEGSRYVVTMADGTTWTTDLCETHATPLEDVRGYGARQRRQTGTKRKTFKRTEVKIPTP